MSRTIEIITYFFYVVLSILPVIFFPKVFNSYELPKLIFLGISILMLGTVVLFREVSIKNLRIRLNKTDVVVVVFLAVLFISDIFGVSPKNSFLGSSYRLQGFLTYLIFGYGYMIVRILSMQGKVKIYNVLFVQLALLSILLIAQYFLVSTLGESISLFQNRYHGTFGNPNFAGGYMAMLFAYILFAKGNTHKVYWFKPLVILLCGIAIILTDSRSAILAVVISIVLYYFDIIKKIQGWIRIAFVIAICAISFSFIFLTIDQSLLEKRSSEWENRSIIWKEGMQLFSKRPILGYGQENVQIIFPANLHFSVDNMHNIFLEYAVSSGIVGLVLFVILSLLSFIKSDRARKMLFLSFFVTAFFNPLSIVQLFLFWVFLGIQNNQD